MRGGGSGAGFTSAAFKDKNRFLEGGFTQYLQEPLAVADPFDVNHDYFCCGVFPEVLQVIAFIKIQGIAVTDRFTEMHAPDFSRLDNFICRRAALRKKTDCPGLIGHGRCPGHSPAWIIDTHAIRSDQADTGVSASAQDFMFQFNRVCPPGFAETGCIEMDAFDALPRAVIDQAEYHVCRNCRNHKIDIFRNFTHAGIAFEAEDFLVLRMNGVDFPFKTQFQHC